MEEVRGIILKTRERLEELDQENSEFKEKYYDKYVKARKDAGIKDTEEELNSNFMKYLVEDANLPGIDENFSINMPTKD